MTPETLEDDPLALVDTEEALIENDPHDRARAETRGMLLWHFRDASARVCSSLAIQTDERKRSEVYAADVFVALHLPAEGLPEVYRSWQVWLHGVPTVVIEIASSSTVGRDLGKKFRVYQDLGVEEYYIFDPCWGDPDKSSLPQPLLVFRRSGGKLVLAPAADAYDSQALGLRVFPEDGLLRFVDPAGNKIPTTIEARSEAEQARSEAEQARSEAEDLRRQLAEAHAELEKLRSG